jgi:hypothetical protein
MVWEIEPPVFSERPTMELGRKVHQDGADCFLRATVHIAVSVQKATFHASQAA